MEIDEITGEPIAARSTPLLTERKNISGFNSDSIEKINGQSFHIDSSPEKSANDEGKRQFPFGPHIRGESYSSPVSPQLMSA